MTNSAALPYDPGSAAVARDIVRDLVNRAGIDGMRADDAVLVVSELVGNSVRHSRPRGDGSVLLRWQLTPSELRIEVGDGGGTGFPRLRHAEPTATSGRGLAIVDRLARSWGAREDADGVTVWVVLPLDDGPRASGPRSRRRGEVRQPERGDGELGQRGQQFVG